MRKIIFGLFALFLIASACQQSSSENTGSANVEEKTAEPEVAEKSTEENSREESSSDQQVPDVEAKLKEVVKAYCKALTNGEYKAAGNLFAPKVDRWILKKNTSPEFIVKESERFLSTKKNVNYSADVEALQVAGC